MKRFLVQIVYKVSVNGSVHHCDEQLRQVSAMSAGEALRKAELVGSDFAGEFSSVDGTNVQWTFAGITGCYPLDDISHNEILMSRTLKQDDYHTYLRYVAARWRDIKNGGLEPTKAEVTATI